LSEGGELEEGMSVEDGDKCKERESGRCSEDLSQEECDESMEEPRGAMENVGEKEIKQQSELTMKNRNGGSFQEIT
jgi:hypothetical protein